jgi:DNA-binding response OmpR family regulator
MVVEDDETIGEVLDSSLRAHGHDVVWRRTGRGALSEAALTDFDLVLLDLGLPDLDGVEVCRQLRSQQPSTVLVMLTARTDEMDVVVGLEAGADDYLTKPVRLGELLARVRAHLRRADPVPQTHAPFHVGDLVVDTAARRATVRGREVPLRAKEFDLLARLAAAPDVAVSRATLMSDVWDEHWFGPTKTLDVHVASLRRKLTSASASSAADEGGPADGDGSTPRIVTLRGHGYRLETPQV